jgi:hypothetical protein
MPGIWEAPVSWSISLINTAFCLVYFLVQERPSWTYFFHRLKKDIDEVVTQNTRVLLMM